MRPLFDEIVRDGEAALARLLAAEAQEDVDLEFKGKDASRPGLTDGDKRTIGKTLSAFANSAGGLLVFGADARPDRRGIDHLQALRPFPEVARVLSEVRGLSGQILLPRHDGIRVEAIAAEAGDGAGYLAIYVERSDRRPHMSKAPEDGRYYKRGGTSTFAMEHIDIEDAFKRLSTPELEPVFQVGKTICEPGGRTAWNVLISVGLKNVGQTLARFPFISVLKAEHCHIYQNGLYQQWRPRWRLTHDHPGSQLTGAVDDVIHIGTTQIGGFLQVPLKVVPGQPPTAYGLPLEELRVIVDISLGAEAFRGDTFTATFDIEDFEASLKSAGIQR